MRTLPIALLPLLAVAAIAQDRPDPLAGVYRVHKLTLVSSDLSRTERGRIVRAFQGGTYNVDELSERSDCKMTREEVITAEDRRMRLPLPGYILIPVGAFLLFALFDHFGKLALARPTGFSVSTIIIAVAMRWKLKGRLWFWTTMASLAALHVPLILFIPWTTKWIPVLVIIPIGIADLYAMLWVVAIVGNFMKGPKAAETREA